MLIVSNWKAYVSDVKTAKALVAAGKRMTTGKSKLRLVIAPATPYIGLFADGKKPGKKLSFGAQDVSLATGGAATGETTAAELASLGVTHIIIGHSERRAMGETDAVVLSKVESALASGLTPILCIGERQRDPEARYLSFLRGQIDAVFGSIAPKDRARIVIAYEPIWAIGKSSLESIHPHDLREMVLYIRKALGDYISKPGNAVILYGGSVDPSNIRDLAEERDVQGFLVGRASAELAAYRGLLKALG